jgi:peptidoglycan/LPS O-acetylase OafA/YrhL
VVERIRGVLPPKTAERDWPQMDPPNVLWFFGAFAISFGVSALVSTVPDSQNGLWVFLVALAFLLAFEIASLALLRDGWWVAGGLAAALAVATFPGVCVGFLQLIDVWPDQPFFDPFEDFSSYPFAIAVATALFGLAAYTLTRFSFIFFIVVGAILLASQFLVPVFESPPTGDDRATTALVAGALVVIVGVFLDAFGRRRDAFWWHALGWLSVAAGLVFFAADPGGDPERGWVPMLIVGLLMMIAAGPMRRATWAVYGVFGFYAAIVYYLQKELDEDSWPFALLLLALGVAIFVQGTLVHRYGRVWADRFVRRPPPGVPPQAP